MKLFASNFGLWYHRKISGISPFYKKSKICLPGALTLGMNRKKPNSVLNCGGGGETKIGDRRSKQKFDTNNLLTAPNITSWKNFGEALHHNTHLQSVTLLFTALSSLLKRGAEARSKILASGQGSVEPPAGAGEGQRQVECYNKCRNDHSLGSMDWDGEGRGQTRALTGLEGRDTSRRFCGLPPWRWMTKGGHLSCRRNLCLANDRSEMWKHPLGDLECIIFFFFLLIL